MMKSFFFSVATLLLLLVLPVSVLAWPSDSQWIELVKGNSPIQDAERDANGGVNVVPNDGSHAAAYVFNDGTYMFYRLRLDARPDGGGNGILAQFGWGFELDMDQDDDDYEWLIMCDGISSPEVVSLQQNTVQSTLGDPSDKAEITVATWPLVGNHRIVMANTTINGDQDYFLDFRIPYAVFKSATGITDSTIVRYFAGSSRSTNNLTDNGADLVGGSNLYEMGSDFITPYGTLPPSLTFHDGSVRFVNDLNGAYDRTVAAPGDTLYIRVDDLDLNNQTNPAGTVRVRLTSPTGDTETIDLAATGVQGKCTGSVPTSGTTNSTGVLYVLSGQTITVTYVDSIAADRSQEVPRTDTILFDAAATDIGITKTVDIPVPDEGQRVTFTITVTNNGPNAVTALSVIDALPAGLTFFSATPSQGSYAGSTWTVGPLARGASVTLALRATVNTGTNGWTITNTATVAASIPADAYAGNNSASAAIQVGGTDLRVLKSVSNPVPTVGDTITYSVRVFNLGPTATGGVQLRDQLPAGVTYVSDNGGGAYNTGTGIWTVGYLASGAGAELRITASVNAGTSGETITNTATLWASTQPDTSPANNSASAQIQINYIDLALVKKVAKISPNPPIAARGSLAANEGATVEFSVTITNNGPHTGTGITVRDILPAGLTYVSHTASSGSYTTGTGLWSIGSLTNGSAATLTIRATINSGTAGQTIVNGAEITAVDQPDSNPGNEEDSATITVNGTDLQIVKTVDNPTPNPGGTVNWTITLTNNGPNAATGIAITDILPAGITYVSYTTSNGSTYDAGKQNSTWVWSAGNLAAGASATLTIRTTVNSGTAGTSITNVAMITASSQADPENFNNVASAMIAVGGTDLAISKTVDDSTPNVGQTITYTLTVSNTGPSVATSVAVSDLLPPEVQYVSHSPAAAAYNSATGLWTIGTLANGASATLNITATVLNEDRHLEIRNTATVTAYEADPDQADNTAWIDILVNAADLAITKTEANGIIAPAEGQTIVYLVTVANAGSNSATSVEVEDNLPAGLTLVSAEPSQGTYAAGLWLVGDIAGSASATLRLTAIVNPFTAGTTITNTASIVALDQLDADATNDSASYAIVPQQIPVLTIIKSADKATAAPGEVITYTVTVLNAGSAVATAVRLTDDLSPYTAWGINSYGANQPFQLIQGTPASGLTLGTAVYSSDNGNSWTYSAASGNGNAPAGYDGNVSDWRLPMTGTMASGGSFTLKYKVIVK